MVMMQSLLACLFWPGRFNDPEAVPIFSMDIGLCSNGGVLLVVEEDKPGGGWGSSQGCPPGLHNPVLQVTYPH